MKEIVLRAVCKRTDYEPTIVNGQEYKIKIREGNKNCEVLPNKEIEFPGFPCSRSYIANHFRLIGQVTGNSE